MKQDLSHLPEKKQEELKIVVSLILKKARVEKIVLFGSFARGDWVEDSYVSDGITHEYRSDFDIFVVVKSDALVRSYQKWAEVRERIAKNVETPVSLIVDSINFVNERIAEGRYFYTDMLRDGIELFDSGKVDFGEITEISPEKQRELANEDWKTWITKSDRFFAHYEHDIAENWLAEAAFHLHQAAESLFVLVLLIFTEYRPKTHDLEVLHQLSVEQDRGFADIFPKSTGNERKVFEILRHAYVDARYQKGFSVSRGDLEKLECEVKKLREMSEDVCREKMKNI